MFHFGSNALAVRRVLTDVGFGRSMVNSAEWWAQILTRVRSRDEAAAAELVAALKPLVTRIVLRRHRPDVALPLQPRLRPRRFRRGGSTPPQLFRQRLAALQRHHQHDQGSQRHGQRPDALPYLAAACSRPRFDCSVPAYSSTTVLVRCDWSAAAKSSWLKTASAGVTQPNLPFNSPAHSAA